MLVYSSPEVEFFVSSNRFFRYFNVIGSDPEGRLGEAPRPELREHGRISGACFDAARGIIPGLQVIIALFAMRHHYKRSFVDVYLVFICRLKEQTTRLWMGLAFVITLMLRTWLMPM